MTRIRFLLALLLTLAAPAAMAQALAVPIVPPCDQRVTEAACTGAGRVMGLDPDGDGFLAVRTGPGSDYPMIDRLRNGDRVGIVTSAGPWLGLEYGGVRQGWADGTWVGDRIP